MTDDAGTRRNKKSGLDAEGDGAESQEEESHPSVEVHSGERG
jgi:hypothetical protein